MLIVRHLRLCRVWSVAAMALAVTSTTRAAETPAAIDFNRDIRPILSENCFYCHGQDGNKREADLRLDDRAAAVRAGAIVPGEPGASTILERIHSTDPDVLMPPPNSNRRLSEDQKKLLDRWIKEGAEYKQHWAFTPPVRPTSVPAMIDAGARTAWLSESSPDVVGDASLQPWKYTGR